MPNRKLFDALQEQGQADLRALLVEGELARVMDELIQRAAHGSAAGLRALGSTAQIDSERFRRLIAIAERAVIPRSPPLTAFLEALQLFVDSFEPSGGFRLLRIARPPILFYGLYGSDEMDPADRRLSQLVLRRGILAGQLDCFLGCDCSGPTVLCQIVLDKILYDVDRAIDLYALGSQELGQPEIRAAAYSYVIDSATIIGCPPPSLTSPIPGTLSIIRDNLRPPTTPTLADDWVGDPSSGPGSTGEFYGPPLGNSTPVRRVRDLMVQELGIQKTAEARWQNLVETMAPNCIEITQVFGSSGRLTVLIDGAINIISGVIFSAVPDPGAFTFEPDIPDQYEDILDRTGVVIRPR